MFYVSFENFHESLNPLNVLFSSLIIIRNPITPRIISITLLLDDEEEVLLPFYYFAEILAGSIYYTTSPPFAIEVTNLNLFYWNLSVLGKLSLISCRHFFYNILLKEVSFTKTTVAL